LRFGTPSAIDRDRSVGRRRACSRGRPEISAAAEARRRRPVPDTSGTTSRPKGVPLTHANLMASIRNIAKHYELSPRRHRACCHAVVSRSRPDGGDSFDFLAGGTLVVPARFSATQFWPAVKQFGVNWYSAVPTIHQVC